MLIAQITDTHIKAGGKPVCGRVDSAAMLRACVADLLRRDPLPDLVLLTGDLADDGRAQDYALLRQLLAPLPMPLYLLAGNHDQRAALRSAFTGARFGYLGQCGEFLQYALDLGPLRLLVLDTVVPGQCGGRLCARRLAWLAERLAQDARPVIIAMHHPPFASGIAHMDAVGLEGADALERLLRQHPQVERLLCGHLHRAIECRFATALASTCPSSAHQIALDLRANGPEQFVLEPPGYQLHLWHAGRLVTHSCVIGDYPGPYRFADDQPEN